MKNIYLLPLMIILLLSACRKDVDTVGMSSSEFIPPVIEDYNPEVKSVTSSVEGQIQDQSNLPIENATVRLGDRSTLTDAYGLFSFENTSMNEKGTFITVTQDGYLDGSRRFFPREGITSKVVIEMIIERMETFDAVSGGTITIDGNATVTFSPNSIANANGEIYDGEVTALKAYLDPTANSTGDRMPGNLQGLDNNLEEVSLQTFGMINITLQDASGAPLNILDGFTASITVDLPDAIAANAPDEIPLWSFNEQFGIWVEEGSAAKIDGQYVGEVSHFSWWNCDFPYPLVELDVTLVDENNNPVTNHAVALGLESSGVANWYSYTNEDGFISGKVPAGETLLLEIRGFCGEVVYSNTIGPFTEDTSLGTIAIENSNINDTEITGSLVDCTNNPITNGGVIVEIGDLSYITTVDDGSFSFFISTCDGATDLTVKGLDFDASLESDSVTGMSSTANDVGQIQVCDNPITESILNVTIDSETYQYFGDGLNGSVDSGSLLITYSPQPPVNAEIFVGLSVNGVTVGNYDNENFCTLLDSDNDYFLSSPNQGQVTFTSFDITEISPNIIGTFSGSAINNTQSGTVTVEVSGNFNIIQ